MRKALILLAVLLLAALSASAVVPPDGDDPIQKSRPEWVLAPELAANPSLDYMERGDPRAVNFPGVPEFFGRNTKDWVVSWDTRGNRPNLIQGRGVPFLPGAGNDLTWEGVQLRPNGYGLQDLAALAHGFMSRNPEFFRVEAADLVLDESRSGNFGDKGELWYVTFQQTYEGIPVEGASVFFRWNHGNLVSFGTERVADLHLNTRANVDADEALARVLGHAGFAASEVTEVLVAGELKIVPTLPPGESAGHAYAGVPGAGYRHELVREVSFRRAGDDVTYEALVDAKSGRILKLVDANEYHAPVNGGIFREGPNDPAGEVVMAFPGNVRTTVGPCTQLNGDAFRINDGCGAINVCDAADALPGNGWVDMGRSFGSNCTTPGFGGAGNTRAARTSDYHLTSIRNIANRHLGPHSWLNSNVVANTNINATCNAFWNGVSVNFYRSGGGCTNTGEIAAVAVHEWGHGMDQNSGGPAPDRASGEAVGDVFSMLYLRKSCIGAGFLTTPCYNCCGGCTGARDPADFARCGCATRAKPANVTSNTGINCDRYACPYTGYAGPMGYQGHCESHIASAAIWNLANSFGWANTEKLWYNSLVTAQSAYQVVAGGQCNPAATVNGCAASNWYQAFLVADDNDGNLANGTPNDCVIWDAFDAQGIACGPRPCNASIPSCIPGCKVVFNPDGSVTLPPKGCKYLTPAAIHIFLSGLPSGTPVRVGARHWAFLPRKLPLTAANPDECNQPGGQLGGRIECATSTLTLEFRDDDGWGRDVDVPVDFEVHTDQTEPTQNPITTLMTQLMGSLTFSDDPDFELIEVVSGSDNGFQGDGVTTITDTGDGEAEVDSFFDLTGEMHLVGTPGGRFDGVNSVFSFQTEVYSGCTPYEGRCSDGVDNDCDGLVDSYDPDCVTSCTLVNHVPSGPYSDTVNCTMEVPTGATSLVFTTTADNGDADLYVKYGSPPTTSDYDCRSWSASSNETCNMGVPQAGTYYVMVHPYSPFTDLYLQGDYDTGGCPPFHNEYPGLAGTAGSWQYFFEDVPPCAASLSVTISGGTGDADLYVQYGSPPTETSYDCRPWLNGNNETCLFPQPQPGPYHIGLHGYTDYAGVLLEIDYQ